ncbi:MAG: hypothetical protein NTY35_16865 [Planctomycetota bacterium]|nr:hypothetical protein [Planctomycetota bacterium]
MRVPALTTSLLAALLLSGAPGVEGSTAPAAPLLVFERTDSGTRAEGLVARRTAVYADGTVLTTSAQPGFARGSLAPAELESLALAIGAARLVDLPEVFASRADWFDLGLATSTVRWSGAGAATVRIAGDLRAGAPDRALAPHGLVELIEFLEAIPVHESQGGAGDFLPVGITLEPWAAADASPFRAIFPEESLPWPANLPIPGADSLRVEGEPARLLADAARRARPVVCAGKTWRVHVQPLFPHETAQRTATRPVDAPQHG